MKQEKLIFLKNHALNKKGIIKWLTMLFLFFGIPNATWAQTDGESCINPLEVNVLPFTHQSSTSLYGNNYSLYDVPPEAPNLVFTGTGSNYYLEGYDAVYKISPTSDGFIDINLTNDNGWVSLWVFTSCDPFLETVAYHTAISGTSRTINNLEVFQGIDYYIIISCWDLINIDYTLEVTSNSNILDPLDDCLGADGGTISSSVTEACSSTQILLNASGQSLPSNGLIMQWQESPAGTNNWTDIPNSNMSMLTYTGLTADTDFRFVVECTLENLIDYSNVITVNAKALEECYCYPSSNYTSDYLSDIEILSNAGVYSYSVNSIPVNPVNGYDDQSNSSIIVLPNETITINTSYVGGDNSVKIWIDWNQNGELESSELEVDSYSYDDDQSISFTIPSNINSGDYRMRIRGIYYLNNIGACDFINHGSAVDLTLTVNPLSDCSDAMAGNISSSKSSACVGESFTLTATGASSFATGIVYQWQSSPPGQNTWTDIAGANGINHTISNFAAETDYRFIVNCSISNDSDESNTISVTLNDYLDCYCLPETYDYIDYLSSINITSDLSNINYTANSIPNNPVHGYDDQSNTILLALADQTIEVETSYIGGDNTVKIWVDWNLDGLFSHDEMVDSSYSYSANQSLSFDVPSPINPGQYRMRIRGAYWDLEEDACEMIYYGSSVDFTIEIIELNDCDNIVAETIESSTATACLNEPFTLNIIGNNTIGNGINIFWQSSPAGQNTWTDINTTSFNLITVNNLNEDTDFRLKLECTFSNQETISNIVTITLNAPNECYCVPVYIEGCYDGDAINNVTLIGETTTINNSSQCSPNNYGDYTSLPAADLISGNIYSISVTNNYLYSDDEELDIWVDWNKNGVFEATELIASTNGSGMANNTVTYSFTVPSNVAIDQYRMRVRTYYYYGYISDACATNDYGETEDYIIEIIDGGSCVDPIVDLGGDQQICEGESITLDAGNAGATFTWSDQSTGQTLTVNEAGTYSVTVTEGNCSATAEVTITFKPEVNATGINIETSNNGLDCTYQFSVANPENISEYFWDFGDGNTSTEADPVHQYTEANQYIVTLTIKDECDNELVFTTEFDCLIGIKDIEADKVISLYPNPAKNQINIEYPESLNIQNLKIVNILGQDVYVASVNNDSSIQLDVSSLTSGIYYIHVNTQEGTIIRKFEIIK